MPEVMNNGCCKFRTNKLNFIRMKSLFIAGLIFLCCCSVSNAKTIELEPRAGVGYSNLFGIHAGVLASMSFTNHFFIQSGLIANSLDGTSMGYTGDFSFGLNLPIYASWRLPLNETTKLRLNAGPYVGIGDVGHLGATAEAGVEFKRFYVGASYFQDCLNDKDLQLNISVGYKFVL